MRRWFKYYLDFSVRGIIYSGMDCTPEEHSRAMGGYIADESYKSKILFFNKYFWGFQYNRLEYYDNFLRRCLGKRDDILSIASGRCANELFLMDGGYKIVCSDIKKIDAYSATKSLFPEFEFIELNILEKSATKKYNAIICLSLIYLFNESELLHFLKNVSDSLLMEGHLLLDSAGSPDNLLSYLILDVLLKYEAMLIWLFNSLFMQRSSGFIIKHHGYRRTNKEIIESARKCGLELVCQENYSFTNEFERSFFLSKIIKLHPVMKKIFTIFGKRIPYIRMYNLKKVC